MNFKKEKKNISLSLLVLSMLPSSGRDSFQRQLFKGYLVQKLKYILCDMSHQRSLCYQSFNYVIAEDGRFTMKDNFDFKTKNKECKYMYIYILMLELADLL